MPKYVNSLDKIVFSYLAAVTKQDFQYEGKLITAKPLTVSPCIFRGFQCPEKCGGCCPRFSLEYLPSEPRPNIPIQEYCVTVNGQAIKLFHYPQNEHQNHFCRYVDRELARCQIYQRRPFHCDFELIRVFTGKTSNRLTQQLFGRKWQFLRLDNCRGALCTMTQCDERAYLEVIRKLKRLKEWSDHFNLDTWLDEILKWVSAGPHSKPLHLTTPSQISTMVKL